MYTRRGAHTALGPAAAAYAGRLLWVEARGEKSRGEGETRTQAPGPALAPSAAQRTRPSRCTALRAAVVGGGRWSARKGRGDGSDGESPKQATAVASAEAAAARFSSIAASPAGRRFLPFVCASLHTLQRERRTARRAEEKGKHSPSLPPPPSSSRPRFFFPLPFGPMHYSKDCARHAAAAGCRRPPQRAKGTPRHDLSRPPVTV